MPFAAFPEHDIVYTINGGNGLAESWGTGNSCRVETPTVKFVIDCGIDRTNDSSIGIDGENTFDLKAQLEGADYFILTQAASDHLDGLVALLAQGALTPSDIPPIILGHYTKSVMQEKLEAAGLPRDLLESKIKYYLDSPRHQKEWLQIHLGKVGITKDQTILVPIPSPHSIPGVSALLFQHGSTSLLIASDVTATTSISTPRLNTEEIIALCPEGLTALAIDGHAAHADRATVPDKTLFDQFAQELLQTPNLAARRIVMVAFAGYVDLSIMAGQLAQLHGRTLVHTGGRNDLYITPYLKAAELAGVPVLTLAEAQAAGLKPEQQVLLADNILGPDGQIPHVTLGPQDIVLTPYRTYGMAAPLNALIDGSGATRYGHDNHDGHATRHDVRELALALNPQIVFPIHARPGNRQIVVDLLQTLVKAGGSVGRFLTRILDTTKSIFNVSNGATIGLTHGAVPEIVQDAPVPRIAVLPQNVRKPADAAPAAA